MLYEIAISNRNRARTDFCHEMESLAAKNRRDAPACGPQCGDVFYERLKKDNDLITYQFGHLSLIRKAKNQWVKGQSALRAESPYTTQR